MISLLLIAIGLTLVANSIINFKRNEQNSAGYATADIQSSMKSGIFISVNPTSSKIFVDGELRGVSPLNLNDLSPGLHNLIVAKDGYQEEYLTVYLIDSKTTQVFVTLPLKNTNQPQGTVNINTDLADSKIFLDGILIGTSPLYTTTSPGIHTAKATKKGYYSISKEIEVVQDYTTIIDLNIETLDKSKEERGSILIKTDPTNANIQFDGLIIGRSPLIIYTLPGSHQLSISKVDYSEIFQTAPIEANKRTDLDLSLDKVTSTETQQENKQSNNQQPSPLETTNENKQGIKKPILSNSIISTIIIFILILIVIITTAIPKKKKK